MLKSPLINPELSRFLKPAFILFTEDIDHVRNAFSRTRAGLGNTELHVNKLLDSGDSAAVACWWFNCIVIEVETHFLLPFLVKLGSETKAALGHTRIGMFVCQLNLSLTQQL